MSAYVPSTLHALFHGSLQQLWDGGTVVLSTIEMRKLRDRETKCFALNHTVTFKWRSQSVSPGCLIPDSGPFTVTLQAFSSSLSFPMCKMKTVTATLFLKSRYLEKLFPGFSQWKFTLRELSSCLVFPHLYLYLYNPFSLLQDLINRAYVIKSPEKKQKAEIQRPSRMINITFSSSAFI